MILFSGLGADASIFAPQSREFPRLSVPRWTVPRSDDSLSSYCERMAESIRPAHRCVIGGASFGGIIALEMARFLNPSAVLLIGSVREPSQFPRRVRMFRPVRGLIDWLPMAMLQWSAAPLTTKAGRRMAPHLAGLARQFRDADRAVLQWSMNRILTWSNPPRVACPVYRIHGDRDRILPLRGAADTIISGGGHVISLTHPVAVNAFIAESLQKVRIDEGSEKNG
jgi:pimeloyl-ACP methyl ester carboxylesterase